MRRLSQAFGRRASTKAPPQEEPGDFDPDPLVAQQKKTFRRWVNSHLAERKMEVKHIINDWDDGILLVALMEILADTNLGKINTKPKMKLHNLENLNKAIAFIEKHVKLVNIGSEDLYTHNQTIVLGLIWTLILRWGVKLGDGGKAALLAWVNSKVGEKGGPLVKNFDKDWQNGMKFAALVNAIDPEFDFDSCRAEDPLGNMDRAFQEAEANLDIPPLLDPVDIAQNPDEKSVMTYVGLFFNAFGKGDDVRIKRVKAIKPLISNATATTADVTFQVPEGAKLVKIKVNEAGGRVVCEREFPKDVPETTFTLTDLPPDTQFACVAVAVQESNDRETQPSESVEFSTSKVGAPNAPRVIKETETSVELEIEPVAGIASYSMLVSSPASAKQFDRIVPFEAGQKTVMVENLMPGTAHAFKIAAVTTTGQAIDPSAPTEATTKMFAAPTARVDDITDSSATMYVDAPLQPVPAGTRFKVQVLDPEDPKAGWGPNDNLNQDGIVSSAPSSLEVDELDPNHTYQVRLIAVSPDGVESPPSEPVSFTTTAEVPKSKIALITGGNTPAGVEIVKDIISIDSKFGKFDIVFVCIREGGDSNAANVLRDIAERSQTSEGTTEVQLVSYDKKNSESVREAAKMLRANKIHLIINNAKLKREQLAVLIGNQQ